MTLDTLNEILKEVFQKVLEHTNFVLTDKTSAKDVDGWESVTHMMLMNEIEEKLGIKFKLMDLMQMNTIGDLKNVIQKKLSEKA